MKILEDIQHIIEKETGCKPAAARAAAKAIDLKYRGVFTRSFADDPAARRDVIVELHKNGASIDDLAKQYKLFPATIKNMVEDNAR